MRRGGRRMIDEEIEELAREYIDSYTKRAGFVTLTEKY